LLPGPAIHPDLAPLAALAVADQDWAATRVQIALGQRKRLADPQAGAPQHDDQTTQPGAVSIVAGGAHDGDDLLDARRGQPGSAGRLLRGRRPW